MQTSPEMVYLFTLAPALAGELLFTLPGSSLVPLTGELAVPPPTPWLSPSLQGGRAGLSQVCPAGRWLLGLPCLSSFPPSCSWRTPAAHDQEHGCPCILAPCCPDQPKEEQPSHLGTQSELSPSSTSLSVPPLKEPGRLKEGLAGTLPGQVDTQRPPPRDWGPSGCVGRCWCSPCCRETEGCSAGGRGQALREREGKEEGRLAEGRCQSNSGHRAFYSGHSESHQPELSGGCLSPF